MAFVLEPFIHTSESVIVGFMTSFRRFSASPHYHLRVLMFITSKFLQHAAKLRTQPSATAHSTQIYY